MVDDGCNNDKLITKVVAAISDGSNSPMKNEHACLLESYNETMDFINCT